MQFYTGPSRRVLRRYKQQSRFAIDGIVDHEEERGVFVKQSFQLQQFRNPDDAAYYNMHSAWTFEYETDFNIPPGGQVPFQNDHSIYDRLLLNKTFSNVLFEPGNCNNHLSIDSKSQTRLAPLLCSDTTYNNVTRPPVITKDITGTVAEAIQVQMGAYNRFWFGAVEDMTARAGITNRQGYAPYTVADFAEDVFQDEGAGNHEIYTAYGIEPSKIPAFQVLRPFLQHTMLGERDSHVSGAAGLLEWLYDSNNDYYYTQPFEVTIPYPLNQEVFLSTFTVPSMKTRSVSDQSPFNYFFTPDDAGYNPRENIPTIVQINNPGGDGVAAHINETINTHDFVKILLHNKVAVYHGDVVLRDIFMFVPSFRIVKGNGYSSIARPRRFANTSANTATRPWLVQNATPMSHLNTALDLAELTSQVPFWANFQNLRGEDQQVNVIVDEHPVPQKLFDYVKVGHLSLMIDDLADTHPLFTLQIMPDADLPAAFRTQVALIVDRVITNRNIALNANLVNLAHKEVILLYKITTADPPYYGYFRVQLDQLNTFGGKDNFQTNNFGGKVAGNDYAAYRAALWAGFRSFQIELAPALNGKYLKEGISPFRSEHEYEFARRIADENNRDLAKIAASHRSETFESFKPFDFRSTYNFMDKDYEVDEGGGTQQPRTTITTTGRKWCPGRRKSELLRG